MKKTLAAVLAAAMALSTATVAFASDIEVESKWVQGSVDEDKTTIRFGKDVKLRINELTFEDGKRAVSGSELSRKIDDGDITLTPVVTESNNLLDSKPSVTVGSYKGDSATIKKQNVYTWIGADLKVDGYTFTNDGKAISRIPVVVQDTDNDGRIDKVFVDGNPGMANRLISIKDFEAYDNRGIVDATSKASWIQIDHVDSSVKADEYDGVQVKFKVKDNYGTNEPTIGIKFRVTVKKKDVTLNGKDYSKGDTLTSDEIKFKAVYGEIDYYKDMSLTLQEVDERNVLLKGDKLYDEIGAEKFTINFEDVAIFEAKLSPSQKKVNLFYNLDENQTITDAYPNVDFEFITFKGAPSVTNFVNSGEMTFNAIGGKNTTVYHLETAGGGDDGDTLIPYDNAIYNPTYGTITVKGVKYLSGTFVVASEILEVEDEEDNEPVNSAPVVEEPSSSEPSSNNGDRNPSTGAC